MVFSPTPEKSVLVPNQSPEKAFKVAPQGGATLNAWLSNLFMKVGMVGIDEGSPQNTTYQVSLKLIHMKRFYNQKTV